MATVEEIENVFRTWAESATTRPAFILERMGPVPTQPYVTIDISLVDPLPHDTLITNQAGTAQTVRGLSLVDVTVDVWHGDDARQVASRLKNSLQADARFTDLWAIVGKGAVGDLRRLDTEYEGRRRRHTQFVMTVYANINDDFNTECFTDFNIEIREGRLGLIGQISAIPDGTAPSRPVGLTTFVVGRGAIATVQLNWLISVPGTVDGYRIYRDGTLIADNVSRLVTNFVDVPGVEGVYRYTVTSFNTTGESNPSNEAIGVVFSALGINGWDENDRFPDDDAQFPIINDNRTASLLFSGIVGGVRSEDEHDRGRYQLRFTTSATGALPNGMLFGLCNNFLSLIDPFDGATFADYVLFGNNDNALVFTGRFRLNPELDFTEVINITADDTIDVFVDLQGGGSNTDATIRIEANGVQVGTTRTVSDTGLSHVYTRIASQHSVTCDFNGSTFTPAENFTVWADTNPGTITSLMATVVGLGSSAVVQLNWDPMLNALGYDVFVRISGVTTLLGTTNSSTFNFNHVPGLITGGQFEYYVEAFNNAGRSGSINIITVTVQPEPTPVYSLPASYTGQSFNTGLDNLFALSVSTNGGRFHIVRQTEDQVRQYVMATPFDLTTASAEASATIIGVHVFVRGITFSPDGTKMVTCGRNRIAGNNLTTPFDVRTAVGEEILPLGGAAGNSFSVSFNADGTVLFLVSDSSSQGVLGLVRSYPLATAYDVSSFIEPEIKQYVFPVNEVEFPRSIAIHQDGVYALVSDGSTVYEYTMSTPFDLETLSPTGETQVLPNGNCIEIRTHPNGMQLYSLDHVNGVISLYDLTLQ